MHNQKKFGSYPGRGVGPGRTSGSLRDVESRKIGSLSSRGTVGFDRRFGTNRRDAGSDGFFGSGGKGKSFIKPLDDKGFSKPGLQLKGSRKVATVVIGMDERNAFGRPDTDRGMKHKSMGDRVYGFAKKHPPGCQCPFHGGHKGRKGGIGYDSKGIGRNGYNLASQGTPFR